MSRRLTAAEKSMISRKVEELLDKYVPKIYRSKEVSDVILKEVPLKSYHDAVKAASQYKRVSNTPYFMKFEMYMEKYGYKEQVDICLDAHKKGVLPSDVMGKTANLFPLPTHVIVTYYLIKLVLKVLSYPLKVILLPFSKGKTAGGPWWEWLPVITMLLWWFASWRMSLWGDKRVDQTFSAFGRGSKEFDAWRSQINEVFNEFNVRTYDKHPIILDVEHSHGSTKLLFSDAADGQYTFYVYHDLSFSLQATYEGDLFSDIRSKNIRGLLAELRSDLREVHSEQEDPLYNYNRG